LKIIKIVLIGLIGLVAILAGSAIRPVDFTPYFLTEYYQQTMQRLNQINPDSLLAAASAVGPVRIGFGQASITPGAGVPLAGFSARKGQPNQGVRDSLFVKALAVKSGKHEIVLVGVDALAFSRMLGDSVLHQITPRTGLVREQILFGATHTHAGPGSWEPGFLGEIFAGPFSPDFFNFLVQQIVTSIVQAHENLKPGSVGFGSLDLPEYIQNRLVKEAGRIDPEFSFLLAQNNATKILLGSYSAHATLLSSKNMFFSGDYPGHWQRRVARQLPGKAMFLAGGVGSHSPKVAGAPEDPVRFLGEVLADSVLAHVGEIQTSDEFPVFSIGLRVSLPEPQVRLTENWRLATWLARKLVRENDTWLQLIRIGKIIIIGTPGDFSGELAAQIKAEAFRKGFRAVVTSFNGSYIGYIIPSKYYHFNAYEPRTMSFFGPAIGDYLPDLIQRMLDLAMTQ
jgi:hypothetical protein